MKKTILTLIAMILLCSSAYSMTFPIDVKNCQIKRGRILLTGWYNEKRSYGKHRALDIPANLGTPVKSVVAGKVIEKGFEYKVGKNKQCFGNYVVIQDKQGRRWYYAHLDSYDVKLNEDISEGQVIGEVGYTGLGYIAAHLHIECRDIDNNKIPFTTELGRAVKPYIPDQRSKYAFSLR